jgi:hypothetical protein
VNEHSATIGPPKRSSGRLAHSIEQPTSSREDRFVQSAADLMPGGGLPSPIGDGRVVGGQTEQVSQAWSITIPKAYPKPRRQCETTTVDPDEMIGMSIASVFSSNQI